MNAGTHNSVVADSQPRFAYVVGAGAYLVVVTILLPITTGATRSLSWFIMVAAITVTTACLVWLSALTLSRRQLAAISMLLVLTAWATISSVLTESIYAVTEAMLIDICIVSVGLLIFSKGRGKVLPDALSKGFVAYVALVFCMTLMAGGVVLDFPPRFAFEYASDQYGAEVTYSQGASNFYGLGAIAAAFWLTRPGSVSGKIPVAALLALNLSLSVIGGARGDTAIALLVVISYLFLRAPAKAVYWLAIIIVTVVLAIDDWTWTEDLLFIARILSIGEGDYGERDALYAQALALLGREPVCLVAGCGVGFFQHFYGYEQGMYPHNVLLESLVIFGLPVTAAFIFLTTRGVLRYYRRVGECDLFLLFTAYAIGVSLKSGSFFGSWLTLVGGIYFASQAFVRLPGGTGAIMSDQREEESSVAPPVRVVASDRPGARMAD